MSLNHCDSDTKTVTPISTSLKSEDAMERLKVSVRRAYGYRALAASMALYHIMSWTTSYAKTHSHGLLSRQLCFRYLSFSLHFAPITTAGECFDLLMICLDLRVPRVEIGSACNHLLFHHPYYRQIY